MTFLLKNRKLLLFILIGGLAGLAYQHFFGCNGTCAITSSPWRSTLYGASMAGLLAKV